MRIENLFRKSKKKYDWNKIWKEYRRLGFPEDRWTPDHIDMNASAHKIIISKRSSGKTTQILLLGLLMNKMYGTIPQYVRQRLETVTPKNAYNLIGILKEFGYIEKLTDGKYTDMRLYASRFTYCNRDDKGKITEESDEVMHLLGIDKQEELYKSVYNAPNGDIIIVDEFISQLYQKNEFLQCMDLISTIGRERPEVYTFFLANSLNYYNMYLQEFGISKDIRKMEWGDKKIIMSGEVPVYVELIHPDLAANTDSKKEKKAVTSFRFGFDNPELASITGIGGWNIKHYPHLPDDLSPDYKSKRYQAILYLNGDMIRMEVHNDSKYGDYLYIRPCSTHKDDVWIYTVEDVTSPNEIFGIGYTKLDKRIWNFIFQGRTYYATNECGLIIEEYLQEYNHKRIK